MRAARQFVDIRPDLSLTEQITERLRQGQTTAAQISREFGIDVMQVKLALRIMCANRRVIKDEDVEGPSEYRLKEQGK